MSFAFPIQVPYFQIDQQGVAFNMWYLAWFDEAMAGFLAWLGQPYGELVAAGVDFQLVHTEITWSGGVRYGDDIRIEVSARSVGTTSFTLGFIVRLGSTALATGETVYVTVAVDGSGKRPIPALLHAALSGA
jgi:acyl-CoA thioester hydrolase